MHEFVAITDAIIFEVVGEIELRVDILISDDITRRLTLDYYSRFGVLIDHFDGVLKTDICAINALHRLGQNREETAFVLLTEEIRRQTQSHNSILETDRFNRLKPRLKLSLVNVAFNDFEAMLP